MADTLLASPLRRRLMWSGAFIATAAMPTVVFGGTTLHGSGRLREESRSVPAFEGLRVAGPIEVAITQGSAISVHVQYDDNLLPVLETAVEPHGGRPTLQLRIRRGSRVNAGRPARVVVVVPSLASVQVDGSGQVELASFRQPQLKVSIAGHGTVRLPGLAAEALAVDIAGSGDVSGHGKVTRLAVSIAGSGDVKLDAMRSDDASVDIAGSGDATVNAQRSLAVSIAGSGDVRYLGDPQLSTSIAGSGRVARR
jgi:Putative auto-transporter adhesin, head GIN domain